VLFNTMQSENAKDWEIALNKEYASLLANQTWELVKKPLGAKLIPSKLIFKLKTDALGNVERFKVRLVAKGFAQRPGIDFDEVYAPVIKYTTLRVLLAKVAADKLVLRQLDVTTAFFNGDLEEEIFMEPPEGLNIDTDKVCKFEEKPLRSETGSESLARQTQGRARGHEVQSQLSRPRILHQGGR
jgi:hypothetical protein